MTKAIHGLYKVEDEKVNTPAKWCYWKTRDTLSYDLEVNYVFYLKNGVFPDKIKEVVKSLGRDLYAMSYDAYVSLDTARECLDIIMEQYNEEQDRKLAECNAACIQF